MQLKKILQRVEHLAIESGRLVLRPKSGDQAAADRWLKDNADELLSLILEATNITAFRYIGYGTGFYIPKHPRTGGLDIQFENVLNGESAHCTFNVELFRQRNTRHGKRGTVLPSGHFMAPKGSAFIRFWRRAELKLPRRLSEFHTCMGKLGGTIFTADLETASKLKKHSIQPLNITYEQILKATGLTDNNMAANRQSADKVPTIASDNILPLYQKNRGFQANPATGEKLCGSRLTETRVQSISLQEQEVDEWLKDYDQGLTRS